MLIPTTIFQLPLSKMKPSFHFPHPVFESCQQLNLPCISNIYVVSWENQGCFKISESPKKTYFGLAFIYLGIHFPNSAISENVNNDLEGLLQNNFKADKNI